MGVDVMGDGVLCEFDVLIGVDWDGAGTGGA